MGVSLHPPAWRERALYTRQRRQEILTRDDGTAPELVAVITEAALMYQWGTREQRHAQIMHLLDTAGRPKVELRLLRFEDGLHPGMCGPINIFHFPGAEPPAVFLETDLAIHEADGEKDVTAYVETFDRIRATALDPAMTAGTLRQLATALK